LNKKLACLFESKNFACVMMHSGVESMAVSMDSDKNYSLYNLSFQSRDGNGAWKKKGEQGEKVVDSHSQYFLWCCVQQQMYQYQLLSAAFASSSGFEPPQIPLPLQRFPCIFDASMHCFREMEFFNPNGFRRMKNTCLDDGCRATRQNKNCERNYPNEKSYAASKKHICKELFKGDNNSPSFQKERDTTAIQTQEAIMEDRYYPTNDLWEESGHLRTQDTNMKQNELARYLEEEYQVAKNNVTEKVDDSSTRCSLALMEGTYLVSQIIDVPQEEVEPEIPAELKGPGGHIFLRMLSRSWRQYKRSLE